MSEKKRKPKLYFKKDDSKPSFLQKARKAKQRKEQPQQEEPESVPLVVPEPQKKVAEKPVHVSPKPVEPKKVEEPKVSPPPKKKEKSSGIKSEVERIKEIIKEAKGEKGDVLGFYSKEQSEILPNRKSQGKLQLNQDHLVRLQSGIEGLDNLTEGGIKKQSITLIEGSPGAGKSIFSMQYIVNGILQNDEPGIYVSFEETKEAMCEDMSRFGWDLESLEKQKKFAYLEYTPEQVGKVLKTGGGIIRDIIDKIGAKRLVIDSISAFTLLYDNELKKREASLDLFGLLRKWGTTTLIIGQKANYDSTEEPSVVQFSADNVILLYNIKKSDTRVRAVEVFKMRGTKHATKTFPFEITNEGIIIYPEQSVF